jgi:hypothetical protein
VSGPGGRKSAVVPPALFLREDSQPLSVPVVDELLTKLFRNPRLGGDLLSRGHTLLGLPFPGTPFSSNYSVGLPALDSNMSPRLYLQIYSYALNSNGPWSPMPAVKKRLE